MAEVTSITDEEFDREVLKANLPVLVNFTAPWCASCHKLEPIVAELAQNELAERVKVIKVSSEAGVQTLQRCGVMALPTLLLFSNGDEIKRWTGFIPKQPLLQQIDALLEKSQRAR